MLKKKNGLKIGIQFFAEGETAFDDITNGPEETQDTETGESVTDNPLGDYEIKFDPEDFLEDSDEENGENEDDIKEKPTDKQEKPQNAEESKFPVTIGGQIFELTASEMAQRLAQPNYSDEQLQQAVSAQLEQNPVMQMIKNKAAQSGLTVDEYMEAVKQNEQEAEIQRLVQEKGIPEEMARELHELKEWKQSQEQERKAAELKKTEQEHSEKMFSTFLQEFPNVKSENIPQEVWEKVQQGMDLTTAYSLSEVKRLTSELNTAKQNQKVRSKAIGSAVGEQPASGERDPFLEGLFGK